MGHCAKIARDAIEAAQPTESDCEEIARKIAERIDKLPIYAMPNLEGRWLLFEELLRVLDSAEVLQILTSTFNLEQK